MIEWVQKQRVLLALEKEEEKIQLTEKLTSLTAKECEEEGISILSIEVESVKTSLYGRTCYALQRKDRSKFPIHNFKNGDEVELYSPKLKHTHENVSISGVISKVSSITIEMVCESGDDVELVYPLRLDMRASEATHKKLTYGLNDLEASSRKDSWPLAHILLEGGEIGYYAPIKIEPFNSSLNRYKLYLSTSSVISKYYLVWFKAILTHRVFGPLRESPL